MFSEIEGNIWDHVMLAYSKCDSDSKGWKANIDNKIKDMQAELKTNFTKCKDIDVPIVPLSSIVSAMTWDPSRVASIMSGNFLCPSPTYPRSVFRNLKALR